MPEIKKILIIRFSSFGDIVLTYSFITQLSIAFPNAQIDFLIKEKFSPLVKMYKGINNVLEYRGEKIGELKSKIKQGNYDLIFDIHKNLRSVSSTLFTHPEKIRYNKGTLKKLLLVSLKINLIKNVIPVYKRYLFALDKIHIQDNFDFTTTDLDFCSEPIVKEPYILIAPSSKHFSKTLPKEKFEQIIKGIKDKKIVLIGDNSDEDMNICNYLSENSSNIFNYCGKSDFSTLTNLIYNSELVLCNDSGVLHLAEALNKKVIVFFGSTVKEFGFYPQLKSTIVFENNNLKCKPCTHIGKSHCPKKHFKCMNDININDVINKIYENIS
ncbi:MAG: glycosyltransferase family 9 protein [Ignavibacteriae bacterium]|nr:glycosyltransferase family 9 protein [Ignavibacteriota bacterium]